MFVIDYQNRKPIYEQIVDRFQMLIITGAMEPDSQLPSVRSLAVDLAINPNTIQKAYSVLEKEGYIYPVKGRGNYVSGNSELKARKQDAFYETLRELILRGRELGISWEMFLGKAQEFYKEDGHDRN